MIKIANLTVFTIQEVAQKFDLSPNSVRKYIREHRLAGQKLGQRWFVSEDALQKFFLTPYVKPKTKKKPEESLL